MEIEGLEGGAEKVCNYQRGNTEKGEAWKIKSEGGEWVQEREAWEPPRVATRESLVLFMRRSVVYRDCGFFKDKIVTTDTERGWDKGAVET